MENLDDFMRQKFNTDPERFEFREEYWEQAKALLEAEEARRRKRRRWLLWWIFGAAVAVGIWQLAGGRWIKDSGQPDAGLTTGHSGDENRARTQEQGRVSDKKTLVADSTILKKEIENQYIGTDSNSAPTQSGVKRQTEKNGTQQDISSGGRSTQSSRSAGAASSGERQPIRRPSGRTNIQADKKEPSNRKGEQTEYTTVPSLPPGDAPQPAVVAPNTLDNFDDFPALPTLTAWLDLPVRDLDTPFVKPFIAPIKPVRQRKLDVGLAATGTLSQPSPDGKRLGASGGVFAHYQFAPAWSLTVGADWRFLAGEWVDDTVPTTSEQLRYSFGYQKDLWVSETRGIHLIEVPVGLRWRHGAFAVEGGFAPGVLVGVQGRLTQEHSESLQNGVVTEQSRVWLSKTPYNQFSPTVFLGSEWMATKWLGLTLRGTYRPGKMGDKLTDTPPPANVFWLDGGLRWHF